MTIKNYERKNVISFKVISKSKNRDLLNWRWKDRYIKLLFIQLREEFISLLLQIISNIKKVHSIMLFLIERYVFCYSLWNIFEYYLQICIVDNIQLLISQLLSLIWHYSFSVGLRINDWLQCRWHPPNGYRIAKISPSDASINILNIILHVAFKIRCLSFVKNLLNNICMLCRRKTSILHVHFPQCIRCSADVISLNTVLSTEKTTKR